MSNAGTGRKPTTSANPYRGLPSVDSVLADQRVRALSAQLSGDTVVGLVREELASARDAIADGHGAPTFEDVVAAIEQRAAVALEPTLRPAINATGVIIHTNLGRAPLSQHAMDAMAAVSRGYSNLEFNLEAGQRGSRYSHLEEQVRRLTGAQAALAVNNNAAALLLTLSALAAGREVIISRGQLVEIGGGFRIPDVMSQSGAWLVEVGTTNRTYVNDYRESIGEQTAALLRVHASNFRVIGFTKSVPLAELASLAHERSLLMIDDLGSGCLLDTTLFGLSAEPTPQDSIAGGADLVLFSGDKLLGGPQAGIIAGRVDLIDRLRRHPLARALRMDKASIAGLAATLTHYLRGEALEQVPVWRMIALPVEEVEKRARRWARAAGHLATIVDGRSMIGGGSLPEEGLPTRVVAIAPTPEWSADDLSRRLRASTPPVVARIDDDMLLLDPRTVDPRDDAIVIEALTEALGVAQTS